MHVNTRLRFRKNNHIISQFIYTHAETEKKPKLSCRMGII